MSLKIEIKNLEDLKNFRKNLQGPRIQITAFQASLVNKLGNNIVLKRIHQKMKDADFSQKIIDGTILSHIEIRGPRKVRLFFISELFSETGFDVALGREKGTSKHRIEPSDPDGALAFPLPDGSTGFSKGHDVDGILALHIIEKTLNELEKSVQDEYSRQLRSWLKQSMEAA